MIKRLAIVFGLVIVLGFFYYLFTTAAIALGSGSLVGLVPSVSPFPVDNGGKALSAVDLTTFNKGGDGWNYITQGYGRTPWSYVYINDWHNGIDIAARYGSPIYSPVDGTVVAIEDQDRFCPGRAFGRLVVIDDSAHHDMLMFAHMSQILVQPGQSVKKGAELGAVGATGEETGTHLHFSVYQESGFSMAPAHGCGPYPQGRDINPVPYLEAL